MIDLLVLATSIVTGFLGPLVSKGAVTLAREVADASGEAAGEAAAGLARTILKKVQSLLASDPTSAQVLDSFETKPDNGQELIKVLEEHLASNPEAAAELQKLVTTPSSVEGHTVRSLIAQNISQSVYQSWVAGDVVVIKQVNQTTRGPNS